MDIRLVNFRCYTDRRFHLPRGVNLIDGPSGRGKSTLLNGIKYALFGNMQKVCRYGEKKTTVELSYGDIHITRTNIPSRVVVQHNGQMYEDDAAQEVITRRFGKTFDITSYMVQKGSSTFFSMSGSEKLAFLEELALHGEESITVMKQSIQQELKEVRTKLVDEQSQCKILERQIQDKPTFQYKRGLKCMSDVQSVLDLSQRLCVQWKDARATCDTKIDTYSNLLKQQKVALQTYETFSYAVQKVKDEYERLSIECEQLSTQWSVSELEQFSDIITQHEAWVTREQKQVQEKEQTTRYLYLVQQEKESIEQERNEIQKQFVVCDEKEDELCVLRDKHQYDKEQHVLYTTYQSVSSQWNDQVQQLQALVKADQTKREEDSTMLQSQLVECNEDISELQRKRDDYIEQRSIRKRKRDMEAEISLDKYKDISTKLETTRKNIEKVKQFLSDMEIRKCILSCPGCKKSVVYKNQSLHTADHHPVTETEKSKESELSSKLPLLVKQEETQQRLLIHRDTIINDIEKLPSTGTEEEIEQHIKEMSSRIEEIQRIQQSNIMIKKQIAEIQKPNESRYNDMKRLIAQLEKKLDQLPKGIECNEDKSQQLEDVTKRIQLVQQHKQKNEWISKQLSTLSERSPEKKYQSMKQEMERLQKEVGELPLGKECSTINDVRQQYVHMKQVQREYEKSKTRYDVASSEYKTKSEELKGIVLDTVNYTELLDKEMAQQRWITEQVQVASNFVQSYTEYSHQLQLYLAYRSKVKLLYEKQRCCSLYQVQMERLETLTRHIIQAEGVCLEQFIRRVNTTMKWYLEQFFPDQSVTMNLDSEKECKNGSVRHEICVHVIHQHFPCELKALSGGEYDRCALAFMLAINELSHSPCLFLDESISSLDMTLSEDVLEVLKEKQTELGKIVLLISHQANTGFFDHVITI
jgi:DNA repair exonuclease SbcCD ATPase subunit